ncbi:MAG TPA: GvpL/GvpF family gas vesicle protein [Gemmatimonadaceae bacterium]|nr:GvpL/GvpF family gas vesicle protein [Gemmatimonadaceae bacterium]
MSDLVYAYAVVPRDADLGGAPAGVDEARLSLVPEGELAAVVSRVSASYSEGVDDRLADVAWLGPRATAHDGVLTWASDNGPLVPLPLLSLFRSEDAVRGMLRERGAELRALLAQVGRGREYGVRVFRVDTELRGVLADYSPVIAELARQVSEASAPGQGYLLARKLEAATKEEIGTVSRAVGARAFERLAPCALESVEDPLPSPAGMQTGVAVLNASFLVAHDRIDSFRAAVTELVREYDGRGFRVEFTGPWPPYHFARSGAGPRRERP